MRIHQFLSALIFLTFNISPSLACTKEIAVLCRCQQFLSGISLECLYGNFSELTDMLRSLNSPIQRLGVHHSNIGELKVAHLSSLYVKQLHLAQNNITSLEPEALLQLSESLESLDLANNSLTKVPDLSQLVKLRSVNLEGNRLTEIPDRAFTQNPLVKQLRLQRNQICSLGSNALNETKGHLELLDLSGNCFRLVPAQTLRGFQQLKFLDLSNNELTEVANLQFMNLPALQELRLDGNKIARIMPLSFLNVPDLKHLYLSDNRIAILDANRFQAFQKMQLLDLSKNQLTRLRSSSFKGVASLKQLFLDHNRIDTIETLAFNQNPKLQMISLQNNNLKTLYRNAFDSLPNMLMLLLGNNSLQQIDRGMFDGMMNLQQLNLRNNSISSIEVSSFDSVPKLTTLDLGWNKIQSLPSSSSITFAPLKSLFWLDLSNNGLETLAEDVFTNKIANIILDGNQIVCDESFHWFVNYLVRYNVRTFLPNQEEVTCAAPPEQAGTRLKELLIKRANETFMKTINNLIPPGSNNPLLLGNLVPGLSQFGNIPGLSNAIPQLNDLTRVVPQLGSIPGLNAITNRNLPPGLENFGGAISNFANPLSRITSGSEPAISDLTGFVGSIPELVSQLPPPSVGGMDFSKVPPEMLAYIINGGEVPGVPRAILDNYIKQYMRRMATAARQANDGTATEATVAALPAVTALPKELIDKVVQGESLPGLTSAEVNQIREYYTKALSKSTPKNLRIPVNELLRLLPNNFDLSQLPPTLLSQLATGQNPDWSLLPAHIIDALRETAPDLVAQIESSSLGRGAEDLELNQLIPPQVTADPQVNTFEPYNIRDLDQQDDRLEAHVDTADNNIAIYTAIGLAAVAFVTIIVVGVMCYRRRRGLHHHSQTSIIGEDQDVDKGGYFESSRSSPSSMMQIPPPTQYNRSGHPAPTFQPPPPPGHRFYQPPPVDYPMDQSATGNWMYGGDLRTAADLRRTEM